MRSAGGTKPGPPSRMTLATNSSNAVFVAPVFHEASGSGPDSSATVLAPTASRNHEHQVRKRRLRRFMALPPVIPRGSWFELAEEPFPSGAHIMRFQGDRGNDAMSSEASATCFGKPRLRE